MSIHDELKEIMLSDRLRTFRESMQLTLGQLITRIEEQELTWGGDNEEKDIRFDFGTAFPTELDSWRGSYAELALGYKLSGYDSDEDHFGSIKVSTLLKKLKEAIGKTYTGWKGGEFVMSEMTPVWVANPGDSGNTGVIGIQDTGVTLVILTSYCEY